MLFSVGRRFSPKGRAVHFEQVYSRSGRRLLKLPPRVKLPHRAHQPPGPVTRTGRDPGPAPSPGRCLETESLPVRAQERTAHAPLSTRDAHQSGDTEGLLTFQTREN